MKKIQLWLLAHPYLIHIMELGLYAVGAADLAYLKPILAGGTVSSATAILTGLGSVSYIAAKLFVQTTINSNQGKIVAWAQDFLENQVKNAAPGATSVLVTPAPATTATTPVIPAGTL